MICVCLPIAFDVLVYVLVYFVSFHVSGACLVVWCGLCGLMVVDSCCDWLLVVCC